VFKAVERVWPMLRAMVELFQQAPPEQAVALKAVLEQTIHGVHLPGLGTEFSVDDVIGAGFARLGFEGGGSDGGLRDEEHKALMKGNASSSDFVCEPLAAASSIKAMTADWFEAVMLVRRLREVRVLTGFTRLLPLGPGDDRAARLAPLVSDDEKYWLPAIDVIGEGVFFEVAKDRLTRWERRPDVLERVAQVSQNYLGRLATRDQKPDREITPRLMLVHSLAHALITQWALDCGYPAAALRERLYVADDMAGFLIYTATSDSAGSLGGIVGLADSGDLDGLVAEAIREAGWCSSDPLCIESDGGGVDGLNLAACHACLLLPEVSCEEMNVFLDRALLIGAADNAALGFFADLSR